MPKDFILTFGRQENKRTLHIHFDDLPNVADLLSEFLKSKGIRSYVTDDSNLIGYSSPQTHSAGNQKTDVDL